jgi:glycosyltransferase involved in cell wall biosynthesis
VDDLAVTPLVALDAREFIPGRTTGIERYLATLVDHARRDAPAWRLELVAPPGHRAPDGVPLATVGARDTWAWDLLMLPRHLARRAAAAYVTPYVKYRPSSRYRVVAVVCDPNDIVPDAAHVRTPRGRAQLAWRRALLRRAAACVTISAFSRDALARLLGLPRDRFRVIPPGIDPVAGNGAGGRADGHILHVSNGRGHKNVARLVAAYAALPPALRARHRLVLAGIRPDARPAIEAAVAARAVPVRVDGHVDDGALAALYRGAAAFAFPSLHEGFGIPLLEAMAHGVPVVAARAGALPETAGDAALLVDPRDTRALADALETALTDGATRARLIDRGRARAQAFPRERTGRALGAIVDEVLRR